MRVHPWWSLVLVALLVLASIVPADARTGSASPSFRPAAGCNTSQQVKARNAKIADVALDGSAASFAGSWVADRTAAAAAAEALAKRQAGNVLAAEFAGDTAAWWGGVGTLTGWGAVALLVVYFGYKYLKDDPPDSHFTIIAAPQVRSVAVDTSGMTPAEAVAVRALAANAQKMLAVTKALAASQNRATGAALVMAVDWVQQQTSAATVYAQQLARLQEAQPALRAQLQQAVAADDRFPSSLRLGTVEVSAFARDLAAHGLPARLLPLAQQVGLDANDLAQLKAAIAAASPGAVAGFSFPGVLTDSQVNTLLAGQAASWRRFAAGTCPAPRPTPTPPTSPSVTFKLVPGLTKIENPTPKELTIDATAGTGAVKHCCEGGGWDVDYTFKVPQTITPGTTAEVMVEITVTNVKPEQPLLMQIDVRAPDFVDAFSIDYPHPSSGSHTFKIPVSADQSGAKEYMIQVGFAGAGVTYTYRP